MDSPFSSRLDSYYVPTDSESLEIQSFIEQPTSRLEALSIQLQELEEQCTKIRNEQSELRLFIFKHRSLISPIRKLPIDILRKIFFACLPTNHNNLIRRREAPILLTQICSFWRKLGLATPQLWDSIHIVHSSSTKVDNVVEWLTRSAACPLDISLECIGFEDSTRDGCYKIIDSLIPFSERWREIRLSVPYPALLPIASLPISKVPLLKTLSLNYPFKSAPKSVLDPQWVTSGVLNAPNLRDFGLSLTCLNWDVTLLPLNWSQLTNISLEGSSGSPSPLSIARAYKLLSLCRNLITCRLDIGNLTEHDELISIEAATTIISLPFLTRLSVREEAIPLSRLFTLLHLPSLNYIEFHTSMEPTEQSSTSLLFLLTRFQTTIKLVTDFRYYTRQDFINCLRLSPLLKTLCFRTSFGPFYVDMDTPDIPYCEIDDAFIRLFFEPSNEGYLLCPHLENLQIMQNAMFSESTLLQFVKEKNGDNSSSATTAGLAKLKSLYVSFDSVPLIDIKQELQPYKAAGLVASLSYQHRH